MSSKNVIVIGGGLAGLAAGVALADSGWRVRLFEQRPYLGGRATSYVLPNGEHVDNCQHVTLGCCTNLADFYQRVGSADKIKFFDRLLFLDPQGRDAAISAGVLPAPFHMLGSFLRFAPLSARDKFSIARAMFRIVASHGRPRDVCRASPLSMFDWLLRCEQTPGAMNRFWRVVLVSALDEELDRTDARFGIDVFWKAFLSNRDGYRMGVPVVPLAELYDGCRLAIERKGGQVILRSPVRELCFVGGALSSVRFDSAREETADAFLLALPHTAVNDLLPDEIKRVDPALAHLGKINVSPITGVHFWFDRQVMTEPFVTLLDTTTQWVFNKSLLYEKASCISPSSSQQYLQLVISASYDLLKKNREEIIALCLDEIRHALPAAREAHLVKATVIKEAAATFSPEPGVDRWRPSQETKIPRMFLAGDWTQTGWPATMEGAVRSGYLAAEAILRVAGSPRNFLQPDLPLDRLVRLFHSDKSQSPGLH
jgi:squalene-associated FAD-dependent desaturase